MITGKNESKILTKTCHTTVNVNLMQENVIQSKSGITINFNANVKTMIYVKKIIFGILLHVVKKMGNILDSYESILVYDIQCKVLIVSKPSHIRFDKMNSLELSWDQILSITWKLKI